jgi:uncharacterized integral membrane protein
MARRSALGRALGAIVTLPLTILVIVFAISNRHAVSVGLWPFDGMVDMPLYLLALGAVAAGFVTGALMAWANALGARWRARREARRADAAEQRLAAVVTPGAATSPALPPPPRR